MQVFFDLFAYRQGDQDPAGKDNLGQCAAALPPS